MPKENKWKIFGGIVAIILLLGGLFLYDAMKYELSDIAKFEQAVKEDKVKAVKIEENLGRLTYKVGDQEYRANYVRSYFETNVEVMETLKKSDAEIVIRNGVTASNVASTMFTFLIFIFIIGFLIKMTVGMSQAKLEYITDEKARFDDVGGLESVKKELGLLVEFLKDPADLKDYVDKIPKGILFEGDPGNGKTMLARVLAGESNTPFFYISAADVEGSYVAQGAGRVGTIFKQVKAAAKKHGKAILFLDELDAIGMNRENRTVTETNQTLNKLLTEMDGFTESENVLVIGATNLVKSLDPALVRSGRFDRIIKIPSPSVKDRKLILELYVSKRKEKFEEVIFEIDYLETLAKQTSGFSGADLSRLVNDALLMAYETRSMVSVKILRESFLRIVMGLPRDSDYDEETQKLIAYHEAAHAVAAMSLFDRGVRSIAYGTIKPYGEAGGHVSIVDENKMLTKKSDLFNLVKMYLAGRAIEDMLLDGDFTTGASSDLMKVNNMIYRYVVEFGMSEVKPNMFIDKNFGDVNSEWVAEEVQRIRDGLYQETKQLMEDHFESVQALTDYFLEHQEIDQDELIDMFEDTYPGRVGNGLSIVKNVSFNEVEGV